jgi:hypothetical protein
LPVKLVGRKSSQGIGLGASPVGGNVYFNPFTETAIAQYNPQTRQQKYKISINLIQFSIQIFFYSISQNIGL